MDRRKCLLGVAGGMTALAGCGSERDADDPSMPNSVEWPSLAVEPKQGWRRIRKWSETYERSKFGLDVTAYERSYLYENAALRDRIERRTVGRFDATLASFFASRIDLRGSATAAASSDRIADLVDERFRERLRDHGVRNLHEVEPGEPVPDVGGLQAVVREYRGEYRTRELDRTIHVDGVGDRHVSADPADVPITGLYAVWKDGVGTAYVAGGAFPAANYRTVETVSLTGEQGEGLDVIVRLSLDFGPDELRHDMVSLVENVE